jgi:hypothetical protein
MELLRITTDWEKTIAAVKVAEYLDENKEVDLRVFLSEIVNRMDLINPNNISAIANILRRKGIYEITEAGTPGTGSATFIIRELPPKNWTEKHPILDKWRTGFIAFLFSLTASILIIIISNRKADRDNSQQIQRLNGLSDSLNILQKRIADSSIGRK